MSASGVNSRFFRKHHAPLFMIALVLSVLGGKPKEKPAQPPKPEPAAQPQLPKDLNLASMRVHAVDMLYELDLSPEQLRQLGSLSAAGEQKRTPAIADEKLATAMTDFYRALLAREEDEDIAKLRNHLTELQTDDSVHLDDEVKPNEKAREKAPIVGRKLGPGQIAAYLASHADQIADPQDKMVGILTEIQDTPSAGDADDLLRETAEEIGRLVAGQDLKKADEMTAKVNDWLNTNRKLTDEQLTTQQMELVASARKLLGDVPPMDIISHWFDNEIATLLSNPQLPQAIDAVLAAEEKNH